MKAAPDCRARRFAASHGWLTALAVVALTMPQTARSQTMTGTAGPPAEQTGVHGTPGISAVFSIVPTGPTEIANCIPFGNTTDYGFTGFIYRNVPAFSVVAGSEISFDLGAQNAQDTRRNIYLAVANVNPAPAVMVDYDIVSQGIRALSWTQVVSDAQTPLNPRGNEVIGDYELTYAVEAPFAFPGGGLIVGFSSSPPGSYADPDCEQVLVGTTSQDPSGNFYARFFYMPHLSLAVLDDLSGGGSGNAIALGGIVIRGQVTPVQATTWGTLKIHYR